MPSVVRDPAPADDARRLRVDIRLALSDLSRTVASYLVRQPLLPRYRLEIVAPGNGTGGPVDVTIVDMGYAEGSVDRLVTVITGEDPSEMVANHNHCAVVLAGGPIEEVGDAIEAVLIGGLWFSPAVQARRSRRPSTAADGYVDRSSGGRLTTRERDILQLVLNGMSNTEIATALHIATTTVRTHVRAILRKMCCSNRHQLMALLYGAGRVAKAQPEG